MCMYHKAAENFNRAYGGRLLEKSLSPLVILRMEKAMVAKVISEL